MRDKVEEEDDEEDEDEDEEDLVGEEFVWDFIYVLSSMYGNDEIYINSAINIIFQHKVKLNI
jgi:hypothetical protein